MAFLRHACLAVALLAHQLLAVNIRLFKNLPTCDSATWLECNDLDPNVCCGNGERYQSAQFQGLPTEGVPAQGVVFYYADDGSTDCGVSCDAAAGLSICLNCVDTPNNPTGPYVDGAGWLYPDGRKRSEAEVSFVANGTCTRQMPDTLGFGSGRKFRIYHDVPESATEELLGLAESDVELSGSGLPAHLREYEIVE